MMGRRPPYHDGDEYDVHTGWRRVYLWTRRAGATSAVKRRTRRRERRLGKAEARGGVVTPRHASDDRVSAVLSRGGPVERL